MVIGSIRFTDRLEGLGFYIRIRILVVGFCGVCWVFWAIYIKIFVNHGRYISKYYFLYDQIRWELNWETDQLHNQLENHLNVVKALMLRFLSFTKSFDYIQKEPDSEVVIE